MTRESQGTNLRVGIFLAIALLLGALSIFAVGEKSGLFEGKTTVYVQFDNINGLVEGAPVRLAGLDVGTVRAIEFPDDLDNREARVTLSVKSRFMTRIREDSIAFIDSKGLLGDKIINITLGSAKSPQLAEGGSLKTKAAPSIDQLASKVEEAIESVTKVTRTADLAIREISTEQVRKDIGRIAGSVANILEQVERGDGLAHGLIYEDRYGEQLHGALTDTRAMLTDVRSAVSRIDRTVAAVERGDGLAHELLFGKKGEETMGALHETALELQAMTRQVREGDGLLHALLYDPESKRAVTELEQAAVRVNHIMGEIEKGRGTIGGLVVDPSVYEDLKTVLGNIERNVLLKALIRFTIKEGDIERPANMSVAPVEE